MNTKYSVFPTSEIRTLPSMRILEFGFKFGKLKKFFKEIFVIHVLNKIREVPKIE